MIGRSIGLSVKRMMAGNSPLLSYGVALLSVALALAVSLLLSSFIQPTPLALFYMAVMLSAWYGGLKPGLVATVLSTLAINYFIPPYNSLSIANPGNLVRLGASVIIALLISRLDQARRVALRQEQQLRAESETAHRRTTHLLEHMTDAFVAFDRHWRYTYANPAALQLLQKSLEELIGKNVWEEVFPSEKGGFAYRQLHQALQEQVSVSWEEFGEPVQRWLEVRAYPSLEGVAIYFQDISERKQAEAALRQNEEQLRLATEGANLGLWHWDVSQDRLVWTDQCKALFGLPADTEMSYQVFLNAVHPDDRQRIQEMRPVLEDGQLEHHEIEYRTLWSDGTVRWLMARGSASYDADGKPIFSRGVIFDITDRKQAEIAIHEAEERLKLAVEAGRMIAWEWNPCDDSLITSANFPEIYGANNVHTVEQGIALLHPEDQSPHRAIVEQAVETRSEYYCEFRIIRPDTGAIVWIEERAQPILNPDGTLQKFIGVSIDISDRRRDEDERKRIEEELRKSEQQLRSAIEVAQFSPYEWNPVTDELIWDAPLKAMWGLSPDAEVNYAVHTAGLHPEDREYVEQQAAKAIDPNGDGIFEAEFRVIGIEDGIERWISARGQTFFDAERRPVDYVGAAQNITDRKRAEAALRESEERFRVLADCAPCLIWLNGADGGCEFVNQAYLDFFGKTLEEIQGFGWQVDLHPDDAEPYVSAYLQAFQERKLFQAKARIRRADGQYRWLDCFAAPRFSNAGDLLGYVGTSFDITDRRQTEEALRESEERFRTLAATVPQLLWTATPDGSVDYLSEQWADYIGLPPERLYDWNWRQVVHPDDLTNTLHGWQHSLQSGEPLEIQHRFRYHTGEWRWQLVRSIPVKDETGQVTKWVGTCTDIHESELRKQDAQFLSDLSETIRTIDHADDLMTTAIEMIGQYLQLKRCYFAQTDEARDRAWITSDYHDSLPSLVGEHLLSHYPAIVLELLRSGQLYISNDNKYDPRSVDCYATVYEPLAIRAHVAVPFFMDGRWAVNLIAATNEPRQWQEREIHLLETAAERIWLAVEKLRSEVALRDSEDRYRALTELSPQLVFMSRPDGFITYVNQWGLDFTGRSLLELQGNGWTERIHPEYRDRVYEARMAATSHVSDYDIEILFRRADGVYRWLYTRALPVNNDAGEIEYWIGVALDITDRKQAEVEAAANLKDTQLLRDLSVRLVTEDNIQTLYQEIMAAAIALTQADAGTVQILDEATQDLLLLATQGFDQTMTEHFYRVNASSNTPCGIALRSGIRSFVDFDVPESEDPGGSMQMHVEAGYRSAQSTPLITRSGKPIGMVSTHWHTRHRPSERELRFLDLLTRQAADLIERRQDEAERKQLLEREQAAREEAERANRIKDEFLAVLSHELRSPLNPILGWSRLLLNGNLDASKTKLALATIERNAKLQSELIEDLLDVSRILQGKLSLTVSPINLKSTIQAAIETVRLAAEAKSIVIETKLDPEVGLVSGDSTRLQQVVWNLLSNAVKFTPIDGQVTMQLEQVNNHAQITVRDTGKGIASDFLPYVFDYFRQADSTTTRKFGGLGLGLAIVRHLVELHGGTIQADSPGEGLGAMFTVKLPLMANEITASHASPLSQQPLNLQGVQILVVDDETDTRDLIAFLLEQAGATVATAASASEALTLLIQSQPDLLVSDIGMPEMNGYMLMQQIRMLPPDQGGQVKAIALTAYAGEIDYQQAMAAGFQQHLSKPIEPEVLVNAIARLLHRV
ncbi:PAS domain S-box protein [Phormidium tenue FACHB-886]|nr:PAS domain S-box protein [Phormidium tenue FACHB-886]